MQQLRVILMLLVVACPLNAHGRTFESNKDSMTSQLAKEDDAVRQMDKNSLDLENVVTIRTPSSAVQDWSLVCQQLCGAALGGAACVPHCENLSLFPSEVQLEKAENILGSKQALLCPKLCGLQLGDDVCTCENYIAKDLDVDVAAERETNVCAILCEHNRVTLTGCTPCRSQGEQTTNSNSNNNNNQILKKFQNFSQKEVVPEVEAAATSTPDWKQLCAALCKTGDGGSLCNCSLSPFRI